MTHKLSKAQRDVLQTTVNEDGETDRWSWTGVRLRTLNKLLEMGYLAEKAPGQYHGYVITDAGREALK